MGFGSFAICKSRKAGKMDCKEAQRNITPFLDDELHGKKEERFLDHIRECSECREEMSIQYLVKEGMARLEEGGSFDLSRDLDVMIEEAYRTIKKQRLGSIAIYSMEFLAILAVIFILILVFMNR